VIYVKNTCLIVRFSEVAVFRLIEQNDWFDILLEYTESSNDGNIMMLYRLSINRNYSRITWYIGGTVKHLNSPRGTRDIAVLTKDPYQYTE